MNTTQQEIRNEIVFISNAFGSHKRSKKLITYDATVDHGSGKDFGVTSVSFVSDPLSQKPFVIVHDTELTKALKNWNDHKENMARWENSFFCLGCRNKGRENFSYLCSTAHGEEHRCDNCSSTIFTGHQPTRK